MTVTCPECRSVFRVDPAKVPASGVRARCAVCGGVITIEGGTLPVVVGGDLGASGAMPVGRPVAMPLPAEPPFAPSSRAPTPAVGVAVPTPAVSPRQPTPIYSDIPVSFPVFGRTHGAATAADLATEPEGGARMSAVEDAAVASSALNVAPATGVAALSPRTPESGPAPGGRPSVNPFLRADPDARARRLSRALVSDLVAYHPQKREEGMRDGTLRQLFRDDIRRSYEEYVEQVGRELAEGTRHFQDALNDILAGGRALF